MKLTTDHLRRNAAVLAAAAVIGTLGVSGVAAAQGGHGPDPRSTVQTTSTAPAPGGDGEQADATEVGSDGESNDHATDTGPDANPDEPGHQDAAGT